MTLDVSILQFLHYNPQSSRDQIAHSLMEAPSESTLKRLLRSLVNEGMIEVSGRGPATRYKLSAQAQVTMPLDLDTYFDKDIDEREVQEMFNFELIRDVLPKVEIFTAKELTKLQDAQKMFEHNTKGMTERNYSAITQTR